MEPAFLEIPDPPYGGYVTSATWNKNSGDIVFDDMSEVGAIIYPVHYFEGYATVTCGYVFTYLGSYDNHYHVINLYIDSFNYDPSKSSNQ